MRCSTHLLALYATTIAALQLPNLQPFLSAIPIAISDYFPPAVDHTTAQAADQNSPSHKSQQQLHELFRRQDSDTCPSGYNNCENIGAPGLCCSPSARCSADAAGHVACCPRGAACTGTIGGAATAGSTGSDGGFAAATSSGAGSSGLLVPASTTRSATATASGLTTEGGFVLDGTETVATPGAGMRGAQAVSWHFDGRSLWCRSYANRCCSRLLQRQSFECWSICLCRLGMMDGDRCNDCTGLALDEGVYSFAIGMTFHMAFLLMLLPAFTLDRKL